MTYIFPLDYESILKRIDNINPQKYSKTRNYIGGDVSMLSPYITRGVVSLPFIREKLLEKYSHKDCLKYIQELAWREYFY